MSNPLLVNTFLVMASATLIACSDKTEATGRWYTKSQVVEGARIFASHCASCHGSAAEGTRDWRSAEPDGSYPPPPLNGSAHAWHHDLEQLRRSVAQGGIPYGGKMPAFAGVITMEETDAAIAYFQSQWPDELYQRWATQFKQP